MSQSSKKVFGAEIAIVDISHGKSNSAATLEIRFVRLAQIKLDRWQLVGESFIARRFSCNL
jgi:hypothetical protein